MTLLFEATQPAADVKALHILYFALRPTPEAAKALCALAKPAGCRPIDPERLHISLYALGCHRTFPKAQVLRAVQAAGSVRRTPFVVQLDRIATWGRGRGPLPAVAWSEEGMLGVHGLHEVLHGALAGTAEWRRRKPAIESHVTLWRAEEPTAERFIAPIRWWVREFVLLDSRYGEGRHEVVDRFPLLG